MKQFSLNCLFVLTVFSCTGCVSSSISDSVALIEREGNLQRNSANYRNVNKSVLNSIQALRNSQKVADKNNTVADYQIGSQLEKQSDRQSYTFVYELHHKELGYDDKIRIVSLVVIKNQSLIINIAPAKGTNTLDQLALSIARAEALRLYISHFNNRVTIKFAPKLSTDTINLVTGA